MIEQDFHLEREQQRKLAEQEKRKQEAQGTTRTRKTGVFCTVKPYVSKENMTKPIKLWLNQKHKAISPFTLKI